MNSTWVICRHLCLQIDAIQNTHAVKLSISRKIIFLDNMIMMRIIKRRVWSASSLARFYLNIKSISCYFRTKEFICYWLKSRRYIERINIYRGPLFLFAFFEIIASWRGAYFADESDMLRENTLDVSLCELSFIKWGMRIEISKKACSLNICGRLTFESWNILKIISLNM